MHINEKHAAFIEALDVAARKAREAVELRAQLQKKQAQKGKEMKEETLRQVARQVRDERAGIRSAEWGANAILNDDGNEAAERDMLRQERHRKKK